MFTLKKIISAFLLPLPLAGMMVLAGVLLLVWASRRRNRARVRALGHDQPSELPPREPLFSKPGQSRHPPGKPSRKLWCGRLLVYTGLATAGLSSCDPVVRIFLHDLESEFPPVPENPHAAIEVPQGQPPVIVILGGGQTQDWGASPISQLSRDGVARLTEGVRLWRSFPDARLSVSGAGIPPVAQLMAGAAHELGVPPEAILIEPRPRDTAAEARWLRQRISQDDIILVTSAFHMRRSVALFEKAGFKVHPAPTGYLPTKGWELRAFLPQASAAHASERVVHEYLGWLWSRLRGEI